MSESKYDDEADRKKAERLALIRQLADKRPTWRGSAFRPLYLLLWMSLGACAGGAYGLSRVGSGINVESFKYRDQGMEWRGSLHDGKLLFDHYEPDVRGGAHAGDIESRLREKWSTWFWLIRSIFTIVCGIGGMIIAAALYLLGRIIALEAALEYLDKSQVLRADNNVRGKE